MSRQPRAFDARRISRRSLLAGGRPGLPGARSGGLLPRRIGRRDRRARGFSRDAAEVVHPDFLRRRAESSRHVRHEARRAERHPRRIPVDCDQLCQAIACVNICR